MTACPVLLRQEAIDRWLSDEMTKDELNPASENALREWPIDGRVNKADAGDDDPMVLKPREFGFSLDWEV